jgi:myo-inositol-1(or 4)-monophosphatase
MVVSSCSRLGEGLVGLSFDPSSASKAQVGMLMPSLLPAVGDFRRISAALNLAYLACGRLDCALLLNVKLWDIAAGSLLAQEAGAWLGDGRGGRFSPEVTLGATPSVSKEFSSRVMAGFQPDFRT